MSGCERIREMFSEYIDGVLDGERTAELENHVEGCPECSKELDALRSLVSMIGAIEQVDPPKGLVERVGRRIEAESGGEALAARLFRKAFYPLRLKLPLEIAGLAAAVILVAWIAGLPGGQRSGRIIPEGRVPRAVSERTDEGVREAQEGRRGGAGAAAEKKETAAQEDVPAQPPAEEAVKADEKPKWQGTGDPLEKSGRPAEPSKTKEQPAGRESEEAATQAARQETDADGLSTGDFALSDEAAGGKGPSRQETRDALHGLPPEIAALVDSAGGRLMRGEPDVGEWTVPQAYDARRRESATRFSAARAPVEKTAKAMGSAASGFFYVVIPETALRGLLGGLPEEMSAAARVRTLPPDSMLVRLPLPGRR